MRAPLSSVFLVIALLLAGCTGDDLLGPNPSAASEAALGAVSEVEGAKKNPRERPFKGKYVVPGENITVTPSPSCPAGYGRVTFTGTGQASHLGRFVGAQTHCQNAAGDIVQIEATLTAANGAEVYAEGAGQVVDNGNGTSTVTASYTITGGTGRFDDATGSFTTTATQQQATGDTEGTYEGGIAY